MTTCWPLPSIVLHLQARVRMLHEEATELRSHNTTLDEKLGRANWRVDELEQMLEDAEIENQHLTEQLEEYLTGAATGAAGSAASVAEESQSPSVHMMGRGMGTAATPSAVSGGGGGGYTYGAEAALTMSALEQRVALAEARRDELSTALEEAARQAKRTAVEIRALQDQLAAAAHDAEVRDGDIHAVVQRFCTVCDVDPEVVLGAALYAKVRGGGKQGTEN